MVPFNAANSSSVMPFVIPPCGFLNLNFSCKCSKNKFLNLSSDKILLDKALSVITACFLTVLAGGILPDKAFSIFCLGVCAEPPPLIIFFLGVGAVIS